MFSCSPDESPEHIFNPDSIFIGDGGDWSAAARELVESFDDPDLRADLRDRFDETAAVLEYEQGNSRAVAEELAFGDLLAFTLARGLDAPSVAAGGEA